MGLVTFNTYFLSRVVGITLLYNKLFWLYSVLSSVMLPSLLSISLYILFSPDSVLGIKALFTV
jgi:hypothetical protein